MEREGIAMTIFFTVYGEPQGKGRPRFSGRHAYTPRKTVDYERLIQTEYRRQCGGAGFAGGVPLAVTVDAYYAMPKNANAHRRGEMAAKEKRPTKKPDSDNFLKVVCDSLNGIAYKDDAQIADTETHKWYGEEPRIEVTIREAAGEYAIKKIDAGTAAQIIETRKPLGLFWHVGESGTFVGIDNRRGDAWTEEFQKLASCKRWLRGGE